MRIGYVITSLLQLLERAHDSLTGVTPNQHHNQVHGDGDHTDVARELFVPYSGQPTTGTSTTHMYYGLLKLDADLDECVNITFKIPGDFVSFLGLGVILNHAEDEGAIAIRANVAYCQEEESPTTHTEDTGTLIQSCIDKSVMYNWESELGLSLSNVSLGDHVGVEFTRYGTNAQDTMLSDSELFGLLFRYTATH